LKHRICLAWGNLGRVGIVTVHLVLRSSFGRDRCYFSQRRRYIVMGSTDH